MSGRGIPLSSRLSSLSLRSQSVSIKSCQKTDPPPETLKIKEFRQEIIDKVNNNQVTLISAETGSGKSTQVPQFIMDEAISKNQPYNIIVTQPRKIAAITIATRVADERNSFLGEEIGYQVGLRKKMSAEEGESRLLFCTTGVVLQKLIQLNTIDQYSHVILDEIHERELDMELLMIIIRELLLSNTTTKIILMSATFNPQPFVDYFTLNDGEELQKPAVMELKTNRNFEININYLNDIEMTDYFDNGTDPGISSNMYEVARKIIEKRITKSTKSILVFLPGIFEIQTLYNTLKKDGDIDEKALVCFLHSSMATVDQQVAFKAANKPKVILSTNIAESSVTIDSVDCVIDFCLTKYIQRDRNSKTSMASLKLDWASKTNLEQRAGRTGRTCDGIVYRLIYRLFYDRLMDYTTPEMQRCPLETVVLRVKLLNHGSPMEQSPTVFLAKALSPPSTEAVRNSIMILKELGGLERVCVENGFMPNDGKLTYIGRIMVSLPLDVRLSKLIVFGYIYSVLEETIIIAAGLSINSVFSFRYQNKLQIYYSKLRWADGSGCDLIAILNAYKMWQFKSEQGHFTENYQQEIDWCSRNNLERKSLHEMRDLIQEIKSRLLDLQIEKHAGVSWEAHEKPLVLKICFAGAFMPNFYMIGDPSEENALTVYKTTNGRDPTKTVYFKGVKRFAGEVIYENTIKTRLVEMGISRRSKDIKVIFEDGSSKIFIQFVGEESMVDDEDSDNVQRKFQSSNRIAGRVKPDVYKALKMRQSEERFHINVMSEEMTVLYAQEHGLDLSPREIFGPPKGMMNHPELCALPSTCTETLVGRVTYIFHCGKFFIQPASKADKDLLEKMQNDLLLDSFFTFKSVAELNPHQFIVVKDGVIYKRAKAVNINSQMQTVTCFLFDYGETNEFSIELVFGISEGSHHQAVFKIPERCFSASLSEIAPSFIKCPRGLWTSKAVDLFKELVANREVTVKIHSVVEEIAAVELWIDGLCVNKELIRTGFAQEFEEIFPRKHNQELRKMIQTSDSLRFDAKDEFASRRDTLVTKFVPSPKAEDCNKTLWLQGPHSPLETKPFSILVQSQASTSIDSRSVNSVLLLEEPENHSGRLLVAANATESGRGVMLHETTIMPNIPGLPVLLALMFAPDIAIKRNSDRTAFESIQFGLGCNPVTRKPYFGQHDCILPFNIDIAEEDFYEINHLRFVMSYLLMTQHMHEVPSLDDAAKLELLQLVKEKTMSILGKKHLQLPTTCASNSDGRWIVEDQSDNQTYVVDIIDAGGFFPLLSCPPVYPLEEAKKEKLKKDLQRALSEVTFGSTQGGIVKKKWFLCPLCDIIFEDSFSLKIHMMSSKAHLNLYKKLIPTDDAGTDQGV